nr:glycoside hydrolase family 1 [Phyllotreta armoraciae]
MLLRVLLLFSTTACLQKVTADDEINNTTFPEYFLFGTASSAYQIEGAWNTYGKGENIWDRFTHVNASLIPGNANADVACDSYHRYKEDVQQLKTIGSQVYRFSLSWSRILPNGLPDVINQQGVDYYRRLIAELKANDVVPYVTLFHFDTPQRLEEMGGWTNSSVVEWFGDYARLAFGLFGDDVKHWMTVNEPKQTCHLGYGTGYFPPGVRSPGVGEYACVKNTILAHAAAWRIYHKEFRPTQKGELGIVIDSQWYEPVNPSSPADQRASEMGLNFAYGLYAYPLVYGDFPPMVKKLVRKRSLAQGYRRSRLPEFSARERMRIKGAYDFFGLNYYSALMVRADPNPDPDAKGYDADSEIQTYLNMTWENTSKDKQKIVPWGIRKVLYWMKKTLKDPKIVITENGMPDLGDLDDTLRIKYIKLHLSSVKDSIEKDGVNVRGYIYWTLMDNFELRAGYSLKFGLYKVDFDTQDRTPKSSAEYFRKVIETRCLVEKCVESNSDNK